MADSSIRPTNASVHAMLCVKSRELSPEVITERLGLSPTRTRPRGEFVAEERPQLGRDPDNYWYLGVRRPVQRIEAVCMEHDSSTQLLRATIEELVEKIEPVADKLLQLPAEVSLMCIFQAMPSPQYFMLPAALLRRLAALNASMVVLWTSSNQEPET